MTKPLTKPQARMLAVLRDLNDRCGRLPECHPDKGLGHSPYCPQGGGHPRAASPREVARQSWPDSVGWTKTTRKYGGHTGAVGGTMPMKAATVLWRLHERGCARKVGASYDPSANLWEITEHGRRVLDGTAQPKEARS